MKFRILAAVLIIIVGSALLIGYDFYLKPMVLAKSVVKIRVKDGILPKNYQLTDRDVYLANVASEDVPVNSVRRLEDAVGKVTRASLVDGQMLTLPLIATDPLAIGENEGIYPLPATSIFAVNGSLRARDQVSIYVLPGANGQLKVGAAPSLPSTPVVENVYVTYVRDDNSNAVKDTESGNNNQRQTSTAKISSLEVKLSFSDGERLKRYLEEGYKFWVVRID